MPSTWEPSLTETAWLLEQVCQTANVKPLAAHVPTGVEILQRANGNKSCLFVLNHSAEKVTVPLECDGKDLLTGAQVNGSVELEPTGVGSFRSWVNSPDGYHGKSQLLEMAQRLKAHHIKLLVDFHYADTWADPGKQPKPAVWEHLDFEGLKKALYDHTYDVCLSLKEQGTPPAMVQVGNEITNGIMWEDGRNDKSFEDFAALLREGYRAVMDCSPETRVMLHLDNGGKNELYHWWFDNIFEHEVPFDLIGASYYPYWHGTLADLQNNLDGIAVRYNKDLLLVETAYPLTADDNDNYQNVIRTEAQPGYSFTPEGQANMHAAIMAVIRAIPNGRGLGIMWWDATWIAVKGNGWDPADPNSGNGWENQALFDYNHRALPAMSLFKQP